MQNFLRGSGQLFLAGEPTDAYWELKNGAGEPHRNLVAGKGEIYMAVDENTGRGVLDLRRVDEVSIIEV